MIKDLLYFLACHHFLSESVDRGQILLLPVEIRFAPLSVPFDKPEHDQKKYDHDKSHPHIQHKKHNDRSGQGKGALDHHGEAVVERLLYRIHIVGKPAHQFSMGMGVKVFQRQCLHMCKQIPTDITYYLLRRLYHQPVIAERGQGAAEIHDPHSDQRKDQSFYISRKDKIIDHRFEEIGSCHTGAGTDQNENSHYKKQPSVISHIVKQLAQCFQRIFRTLIPRISCHYRSAPSF